MVIYITTNLINGKVYIGKDKHNNKKYLGSGLLLKAAIKKYGISNFKKEILEFCDSIESLNEKEKFWIKQYQSFNKEIGYNLTLGGDGGLTVLDPNEREKIYKKIKSDNSLLTEEELSIKYGKNKGKKIGPHSEETKIKIGDKNRGENNGMFGEVPWNKGGNCYTDEQIKKFSESHLGQVPWNKGIPATEESKKNQSIKMTGRKMTQETKNKISDSLKNSEKKKISDINKKGLPGPNKDIKLSQEIKNKISNSLRGKPNNTKGTKWIYDPVNEKYKRVSDEIIEEYIIGGWILKSPREK